MFRRQTHAKVAADVRLGNGDAAWLFHINYNDKSEVQSSPAWGGGLSYSACPPRNFLFLSFFFNLFDYLIKKMKHIKLLGAENRPAGCGARALLR